MMILGTANSNIAIETISASKTWIMLFLLVGVILSFLTIFLVRATKIASKKCPPGPFPLPFIGNIHLLGFNLHQSFHRLSRQYGPLMLISIGSLQSVVVSSPEIAREFLRTHEFTFSSRPMTSAMELISYNVSFAFAPYGPYWKFAKKLLTKELLGSRNLNHFRLLRTVEISSLLKVLLMKAKACESVNISVEVAKTMNNVITQMMFSHRCIDNKNGVAEEGIRDIVREITKIFGEFDLSNVVWFCRYLDLQGLRKSSMEVHRKCDALLEKIIKNREEETRDGKRYSRDLLDMMLNIAMDDHDDKSEVKFTMNHLKALILDFFVAGTDTSSSAIEWTISELINNPRVLKKAQEELDRVIGNNRLVEESDCPNLPYIQAIFKETLRLHPPVPMIHRKSTRDCIMNGYKIDSETMLFVNLWSMGRNPEYWENPLDFFPERFLQSETCYSDGNTLGRIDFNGQNFEFMPFGTGIRGCPGMNLVLLEIPHAIAAMIHCFEWKLVGMNGEMINEEVVDMTERSGLTTSRANDLICRLEPRFVFDSILDV